MADGTLVEEHCKKEGFAGMDMKQDNLGESPVDVYSLIKSLEIREFLRREADFGTAEKREVILHSYIYI